MSNLKRSDRNVQDPAPESMPQPGDSPLFGLVRPDEGPAPPAPEEARPEGTTVTPPPVPPVVTTTSPVPAPDPFDPKRLRLRQDFGANLGLRKRITHIPVDKPPKESYIRCHPDTGAYWLDTCVIELKQDRETYLVLPELWPELEGEATFGAKSLALSVHRDGSPFLWPLRLPGPDGKLDNWGASAREAAMIATTVWTRVTSNLAAGVYDAQEATGIDAEPTWPAESMGEILRVAFRGKVIETPDHPVLRRLRGEV